MKSSFVPTALVLLLAAPAALYGQDRAPLGKVDIGVKLGYVAFSEGIEEDDGVYLGVAVYGNVAPYLYVGAEAAAASSMGVFDDEMRLAPFELNVRYARGIGSSFIFAGGAGLTYAYAEFQVDIFDGEDLKYDEWLLGGQIFADLVFRIAWFDLGVNAKYQLVQDFEPVEADFSNLRLGLQAGVIF